MNQSGVDVFDMAVPQDTVQQDAENNEKTLVGNQTAAIFKCPDVGRGPRGCRKRDVVRPLLGEILQISKFV